MELWRAVMRVSRAMQIVYQPLNMKYQLLGDRIAHLHWSIAPRFVDDVAPGDPRPASAYQPFPEDAVRHEEHGCVMPWRSLSSAEVVASADG